MTSQICRVVNGHGFLFMFNRHIPSILSRLWIIIMFSMGRNGGMLISEARGRPRPEVSAPFNSYTSSFYSCSVGIFRLSLTVQKLVHIFHLVVNSHMGTKWGFLATLNHLLWLRNNATPKSTSVHQTTSFKPLNVQIGCSLRSTEPLMMTRYIR